MNRLAAELGFGRLLDRIPKKALSGLVQLGVLPPRVIADPSFAVDPDHIIVIREINRAIAKGRFTPEERGRVYTLPEFISTAVTLCQLMLYIRKQYRELEEPQAFATSLASIVNDDSWLSALEALLLETLNVLVGYMRFDERILVPKLTISRPYGRPIQPIVTIHRVLPRMRDILADGYLRRAYQCGSVFDEDAVHWLDWQPELAGDHLNPRPKPVFVQSHALRRLLARLGDFVWANDAIDAMYLSLREPQIVRGGSGSDLLVEYRLWGKRMGYLVVSVLDDLVLVRSFLFLTMRGTPEESVIRRRTNGHSRTAELMGLDKLSCFVESDVRHDQDLRNLFTECGCGHLFEFGDEQYKNEYVLKRAQHIRRILGLRLAEDPGPRHG